MRAVVATRSSHKLGEIRRLLSDGSCLELVSLEELGIAETAEEDDLEVLETFVGNALAKARHFARLTGLPTLADDSGICVDALDGGPGVRSKRFSGRTDVTGAALDGENNRLLLERLGDLPPEARSAHYVCVAAAVLPDGEEHHAVGRCDGVVLDTPRGHGGFGYDPLFLVEGFGRTFGELPPEVKAEISHRARAFRALEQILCGGAGGVR